MIANTRITMNFQSLFAILCIAHIKICLSFSSNTSSARSLFSSISNSKISRNPILVHRFEKALYMSSESEPPLTAFLDKLSKTGLDNTRIQKDSLVVAKYDLPELGIFADQTYQLHQIYAQGTARSSETRREEENTSGVIEKIEQPYLDLSNNYDNIPSGFTVYITLYSKMYHDNDRFGGKAIITTPEEVGLVSMKDEVFDSVLVALPILSFWLGTCFTFSNWYTTKYGGNFFDALLRH